MQSLQSGLFQLRINPIMEYDWGSESKDCLIYQLTHKNSKKYAQLWMGTHKNGPSMLDEQNSLSGYLKQHNLQDLPFLFKVLCVQKALSIQLHPNKLQAERLFQQKKGIYSDSNEKPQMFYTLTPFQCLFGIITEDEMAELFKHEPFSLLQSKGKRVKEIFAEICGLSQEILRNQIDILLKNTCNACPGREKLITQLQIQHPYDAGILVSCFLRYKKLPAGQCYAIEAGLPHAYLRGTCLQIMKNSDNVVRLGLTPKLKDIPTLLEIIKDDIGVDGIKVEPSQAQSACLKCLTNLAFGPEPCISIFRWGGLSLSEFIHETSTEATLEISALSIGIILNGELRAQGGSIMLQKGGVLFFNTGKYKLIGPFRLFVGSYF